MYLKALLSIFKGKTSEKKDKDTAVERCEVELHEDAQQTECRLSIRMICGLGVIKSYKLTYEPATVQHAVFDRTRTINQWAIEAKFLRGIVDHFSPSAEQLDIYSDGNGKAIFTSFTTKVTDGKEILKQPIHTSVAIDRKDFEDFLVEDHLHVAINVKDFKAAVAHAETLNASVTARYSRPCRPLQLAYESDGINSEFTLMTRGEADPDDIPPSSRRVIRELSARQTPAPLVQPSSSNNNDTTAASNRDMPPPSSRRARPLTGTASASVCNPEPSMEAEPSRPSASIDFDNSLFVPADDDRQWDETNEEETTEDVLGWDASMDQETLHRYPEDSESRMFNRDMEPESETVTAEDEMGIPPTQRISQLHGLGLFD